MAQEWDEKGTPITAKAPAQEWDEHGKPVGAAAPAPTGGAPLVPSTPNAFVSGGTMAGAQPARVPTPVGLQGPMSAFDYEARHGIGALEGLSELGQGMYGLGKSAFMATALGPTDPRGQKAAQDFYEGTVGAQLGEFKKAKQTKGLERAGHLLAGNVPLAGPMAAGAGEAIGQGDYARGAVLGAAAIEGGRGVAKVLTPAVADAARQVKHYSSINEGQVRTANQGVRAPLNRLEARINDEIGRHANAVIDADEAQQRATGTPGLGSVDATGAAAEARTLSEKIGGEFATRVGHLIMRATQGPLSMREAKALTTDVGREAARTKNLREAAVLNTLYDGLHRATDARAAELGPEYARSWQHYIDETRSWKSMKSGLAGDLQAEPNHANALKLLSDPKNSTEAAEIAQKMKQYGVDPKDFDKAREVAPKLEKMGKESRDNFHGIIRGIFKHPITVGGSYYAMHMVPGAGWILPLVVAGTIGGLLDKADMAKLLNEIGSRFPGEKAGRVTEPGKGPMPTPTTPPGGGPSPQNIAAKYGLVYDGEGMGIHNFRDPQVGGGVSYQEGKFDEAAFAKQVAEHRNIDPSQLDPLLKEKQSRAKADLDEALDAEEERKLRARLVSRAKKAKGQ